MAPNVFINAERAAYKIEDIYNTMTVGELISALQEFDEDSKVYLSHDNGYTFGGITWSSFNEEERDY